MEKLKRIPTLLFLLVWLGYLGYQGYLFLYAPEGEVAQHQGRLNAIKAEIEDLKRKKKEGEEFIKTVDAKSDEIITQSKKLADFRGALSESADIPAIVRLLLTEAKRLDVRVDSIQPGSRNQQEFFLEQQIQMSVRGTYKQLASLFLRFSKTQRILRLQNFNLSPSGGTENGRSPQLSSRLIVSSYQYTSSKEDSYTGGRQ
jgi:Tfp pilus assembly protein PilO